jgi:hypothetical protein
MLILGFTLLNLTSWCSAESIAAEHRTVDIECSTDAASNLTVPNLVLVGTDVVDIESFNKTQEPLGKSYSTEIGGATLVLSLDLASDSLVIIREFKEPGQPAHTKTYNICIAEGNLSSDELHISVVKNGILIFETDPDVDGIPSNLWILYEKTR